MNIKNDEWIITNLKTYYLLSFLYKQYLNIPKSFIKWNIQNISICFII